MADKTSFTKDEWALLLKSPMIAGMAVTAADPSGLWGLLKESFAGGAALTKVATDANANALIKAVVADFSTSEGRSIARDGLQADFSGAKPEAIKNPRRVDAVCLVMGADRIVSRPCRSRNISAARREDSWTIGQRALRSRTPQAGRS